MSTWDFERGDGLTEKGGECKLSEGYVKNATPFITSCYALEKSSHGGPGGPPPDNCSSLDRPPVLHHDHIRLHGLNSLVLHHAYLSPILSRKGGIISGCPSMRVDGLVLCEDDGGIFADVFGESDFARRVRQFCQM
jgi:hypothetical protein